MITLVILISSTSSASEIAKVREWLSLPKEKIDFAQIKVGIDKMVDPAVDTEATLKTLDRMVAAVYSLFRPNASSMEKYLALKKYLYEKGPWNNNQAFQYDFDDPMGYKISNKILANYIKSQKGNCVSMPILFLVLGQKIGLDLSLSTAPSHVLVKFTETETGRTFNVEATSGGGFTRDEWYKKQMPMTDEAIANGIYLQKLSKRESAAEIVMLIAESYYEKSDYEKAIEIMDVILKAYPKSVYAVLKTGGAYYKLLERYFFRKYRYIKDIPPTERAYFKHLRQQNQYYYAKAESLGWREPPRSRKDQYLDKVKNAANGTK